MYGDLCWSITEKNPIEICGSKTTKGLEIFLQVDVAEHVVQNSKSLFKAWLKDSQGRLSLKHWH